MVLADVHALIYLVTLVMAGWGRPSVAALFDYKAFRDGNHGARGGQPLQVFLQLNHRSHMIRRNIALFALIALGSMIISDWLQEGSQAVIASLTSGRRSSEEQHRLMERLLSKRLTK
jgi:hypothetical protein